MSEWYYAPEGRTEGPVSLDALVQLLGGPLPPDTPVWREGQDNWLPANAVAEIAARMPALKRPPAGVVAAVAGPTAEARSLNPFVVMGRCFAWKGRFTRGEYLVAVLANMVLSLVVGLVAGLLAGFGLAVSPVVAGVLAGLLFLALIVGSTILGIGAAARRINDLGLSLWWLLIGLVPLANFVFALILLFAPSNPQAQPPTSIAPAVVALAACGVGVLLMLAITAAVAIPGFVQARNAGNEAVAVGWVRTMVSGQTVYAASNGGLYESRMECLVTPSQCIPGYSGSSFISPDAAQPSASGYSRQLHAAPVVPASDLPAGASPSSTTGFVVVALPAASGSRAFCADASGTVFDVTQVPVASIVERMAEAPYIRCNPTGVPLQ